MTKIIEQTRIIEGVVVNSDENIVNDKITLQCADGSFCELFELYEGGKKQLHVDTADEKGEKVVLKFFLSSSSKNQLIKELVLHNLNNQLKIVISKYRELFAVHIFDEHGGSLGRYEWSIPQSNEIEISQIENFEGPRSAGTKKKAISTHSVKNKLIVACLIILVLVCSMVGIIKLGRIGSTSAPPPLVMQ